MKEDRKAVFLDRDGVLNRLVWNPLTRAFESPLRPEDLVLCDDIIDPLKRARAAGYMLFIVSNQPNYAKGKTTLESISEIAENCLNDLNRGGIPIDRAYYCLHHPEGIIREYSFQCVCRKPEPFFLLQAQKDYQLNLRESWMIGDRDSDVECGRRAGCLTVLIENPQSAQYQGESHPDYVAKDVSDAVSYILHS